ncbi:MAG: glycosyltransferase [Flavobacteriales bacterium]|jgi:glycosyltransferase involved in cell wall biosynthesis
MKILFVFHEARLTGASLALFRVVSWLKRNSDIQMSFLFNEKGPLQQDLLSYGTTITWDTTLKYSRFDRLFRFFIHRKTSQQILLQRIQQENFDLIYFNTIVASDMILMLAELKVKKLWHIHELELAAKTIGIKKLNAISLVDCVVANSESTKSFLLEYGVDRSLISVFYPSINIKEIMEKSEHESQVLSILPIRDSFVIGSAGTVLERKGVQAFLILAKTIDRIYPFNNFKFVWVGALNGRDRIIIEHDIHKAELEGKVFFTGELSNPYPVYKSFDVFVSTSKEESFGLALIESACLGKALFCFTNSHEIERLVKSASNYTAAYLDVLSMGEGLIELSKDKNNLLQAGQRALAIAESYDEDEIMPPFLNFLKAI